MQPKTKLMLKPVVFLLLFALLFAICTHVLRNKNEAGFVKPFYKEPKNSIDVIFVGSSHIMCSVYPMELWKNHGITSYNYASSSQLLPQSYYQVLEALRFQSPKLIVLDVSGVLYNQMVGMDTYAHLQLDNMKMGRVKLSAIRGLFPKEKRLEYYMNFLRFHSRWKELTVNDFIPNEYIGNAYISTSITPKDITVPATPDMKFSIPENAELYLRKIIEECKEKNIDLLLVNIPGFHSIDDLKKINKVFDIAAEFDLQYLNFMYRIDELGFDFKTDMRDDNHCNAYGAMKVTDYLGKFIVEHYDVPTRHSELVEQKWAKEYAKYKKAYPSFKLPKA